MIEINKLALHATGLLVILGLVTPSTFGENRPLSETLGVSVHELESLILASRSGGSPRDVVRDVAVGELERVLREQLRPSRTPAPAPTPRRDDRRAPRTYGSTDFIMPVVGVDYYHLQDSFGDPRSGGRSHRGIDIFAPRWTEVVASVDGTLAITTGARSGKALWLMGRDGRDYFYAHLEDWAGGIYDGMRVGAGQLVGYVGNSGNAISTPPHLHFEVHQNGSALNPYHVLADARTTSSAHALVADGRSGSEPRRPSLWQRIFGRSSG